MTKKKFILNFTPTGLIPTKDLTPHVPIDPEEIISGIRRKNKVLVLGVSTSGRHFTEFEKRSDVLDRGLKTSENAALGRKMQFLDRH